jgi:hypothetical protein
VTPSLPSLWRLHHEEGTAVELVLEVKDLAPVRRVNGVTWERVELLTEFLDRGGR